MSALSDAEFEPLTPPARPFGVLGLIASTLLIFAASISLSIGAALLVFAGLTLTLGQARTAALINSLRSAMADQSAVSQEVGMAVSIVLYAAVIASIFAAARLRGGSDWPLMIGWNAWTPFRRARLFWALLIGAILYNLAASALVSHVYPQSNEWINLPKSPLWMAVFFVLAAVFAPLAEELLFRGWIYTSLRRSVGVWLAILITSIFFALAHWEKTHLYALAVFPVGVLLGVVRERAQSLKASITFHALYNAAATAITLVSP